MHYVKHKNLFIVYKHNFIISYINSIMLENVEMPTCQGEPDRQAPSGSGQIFNNKARPGSNIAGRSE